MRSHAPAHQDRQCLMKEITVNEALACDSFIAQRTIDEKRALPRAMLPVLCGLQETFGYIAEASDSLIIEASSAPRTGVVTSYPDFRLQAPATQSTCLRWRERARA